MIEIKRVGVIGAGQMGTGIAQACATAGFAVRLNDREEKRIDAAFSNIDTSLAKLVSKGKLEERAKCEAQAHHSGLQLRGLRGVRSRDRGGHRERGDEVPNPI